MGLFKELVSEYMDYFKATFARCMFLMHALVIIWRTVVLMGDTYWFIALGILLIIVEYIVTIIVRNGQEWNWVSPATFCYLVSAVPGLWVQKLYHLGHLGTAASDGLATVPSTSMTLDFSAEDWMSLSEQTMLVTIILSRWLLPKGHMTHNEVANLLLLYLSLSSDIIDFLSIFTFQQVASDESYCYVLLFWWSWALVQFTLVLTSTRTDDDQDNQQDDLEDAPVSDAGSEDEDIRIDSASTSRRVGERTLTPEKQDMTSKRVDSRSAVDAADDVISRDEEEGCAVVVSEDQKVKSLTLLEVLCSSELWSILVVFFLQDGPFLANRLVVMLHFNVFNYTIIFFVCKNLLVLALQTYRMVALCMESRAKVKDSQQRVKTHVTDRRYSTNTLRTVASLDYANDTDDDDDGWEGRNESRASGNRRRTPEGKQETDDETTDGQLHKSSAKDRQSFNSTSRDSTEPLAHTAVASGRQGANFAGKDVPPVLLARLPGDTNRHAPHFTSRGPPQTHIQTFRGYRSVRSKSPEQLSKPPLPSHAPPPDSVFLAMPTLRRKRLSPPNRPSVAPGHDTEPQHAPSSRSPTPSQSGTGRREAPVLSSARAVKASDPSIKASNPTIKASDPSIKASNPTIKASDPSIKASNPTIKASDPSIKASNPTIKASDPSIKASNPTTKASDPSIKASDFTSKASDSTIKTSDPRSIVRKPGTAPKPSAILASDEFTFRTGAGDGQGTLRKVASEANFYRRRTPPVSSARVHRDSRGAKESGRVQAWLSGSSTPQRRVSHESNDSRLSVAEQSSRHSSQSEDEMSLPVFESPSSQRASDWSSRSPTSPPVSSRHALFTGSSDADDRTADPTVTSFQNRSKPVSQLVTRKSAQSLEF